jgi:DNA anti-recombination protein RmuC
MVETGVIKKERIDQSYKRVMNLKKKLAAGTDLNAVKQQLVKTEKQLTEANQSLNQILTDYKDVIDKEAKKRAKRNKKKKK